MDETRLASRSVNPTRIGFPPALTKEGSEQRERGTWYLFARQSGAAANLYALISLAGNAPAATSSRQCFQAKIAVIHSKQRIDAPATRQFFEGVRASIFEFPIAILAVERLGERQNVSPTKTVPG